jgi:hypothetical protein
MLLDVAVLASVAFEHGAAFVGHVVEIDGEQPLHVAGYWKTTR